VFVGPWLCALTNNNEYIVGCQSTKLVRPARLDGQAAGSTDRPNPRFLAISPEKFRAFVSGRQIKLG